MFFLKKPIILTFILLLIPQFVYSATHNNSAKINNEIIKIPNISGAIVIDASLNEPQWQSAKKVFINNVTRPYDNVSSPVHTEALLMESDGYFYLAFIAKDPNISEIRAFLKDRDKSWGEDLVGIKIDTYNDQRSAYRFLVNPLGVQIDGIESEVTQKESDAWDGIWESAGKIVSDGFIVEMALPLRMLNFKESTDKQTWGLELLRYYPREESLRLSNIHLDRGNSCEICQIATASGFKGAKQGSNFTVAPSIVLGTTQDRDDNNEWQNNNNTEASLDLRWGITPDWLLNATINPDFSTVEADNAQLNINNTFALFNREKRPFFLDNQDYFDSDYNLVYTRNINAPNYGAKLTGRENNHAFGLFITDDQNTNILIPGNRSSSVASIDGESKAAALRYRYSFNNDITLGWISTLRTAEDYSNNVNGIDARFRLSTADVFKFQTLFSTTEYPNDLFKQFCNVDEEDEQARCATPENNDDCQFGDCIYNENVLRTLKEHRFTGNAFKAGYYHNDSDWYYRVTYDRQNAGFRGDLGFMSRVDHNKFSVGGDRKWYAEPGKWWSKFKIYSDWDIIHNDDNQLIEKEFDINAQLNALNSSYLRLGYTKRESVGSRLDKSNLAIADNTTLFSEDQFFFFAETKPLLGLYINTNLTWGDKIDYRNNRLGEINRLSSNINWNIDKHLEVKLRQTFSQLNADGANVFIARLTDLRTTYQFNVQSFLRLSFIFNNTSRNPSNYLYSAAEDINRHSKNLSTELLYAYKINPQTVFYLGYSDRHYSDETIRDLAQEQRSLFMKFSYAWLK
ncbi:carbohydrate binding family 9 domain-containing protein [Colwellia sp. BRX10-3]|uniref:carbohydrate binding family 9 domain-containing protein n=1 Tax=Colwellia sp. BRX10-3 TaxID=2759844 RepID=UPI0015F6C2A6|nr:carbohydrate binding family 9 domain-containing protein [Colwellia sp. BRX10-3]MBA6392221.1 carbohydrate binding family 9 domain-containing protein [Colwellia sp. BRX10-3]